MQAMEASGLGREAYSERVRVQDEAANALVDEAFSELGLQAAKREALVRAFETSGKPVDEFAGMYGMDAAEVNRAVARVHQDAAART